MIYYCADDFGLCCDASCRILQCISAGGLNKVSVFPNIESVDLTDIPENVRVSLHLNLVEGKCMANAEEIYLIADKDGDLNRQMDEFAIKSNLELYRD